MPERWRIEEVDISSGTRLLPFVAVDEHMVYFVIVIVRFDIMQT